jgi:toxin YoeB
MFTEGTGSDCLFWQPDDRRILSKINELLGECVRAPFVDRGKPEALKLQL